MTLTRSTKKPLFFLFFCFLMSFQTQLAAQSNERQYGNPEDEAMAAPKFNLSVGYGTRSYLSVVFKFITDVSGDYVRLTSFNPTYLKAEYRVADHFAVGIASAYNNDKFRFNEDGREIEAKLAQTSFLIRTNFPLTKPESPFIPYFGLSVGALFFNYEARYTDNNQNYDFGGLGPVGVTGEATFGMKYFFTPNIGAYTELGVTRSLFQVGLSARF